MTLEEQDAIRERAAIIEFDGGLTREDADRKALEAAQKQRNPQREMFEDKGK